MASRPRPDDLAALRKAAVLREHRFISRVPLVGGLIAAFRRAWNSVSTRWYVSSVMQQQTDFNLMAVDRLVEILARVESQANHLAALQEQVAALHDDMAGLRGDMSALQGDMSALQGDMTQDAVSLRTALSQVQDWLIEQDREQTELRHDLGEIALRVRQLTLAAQTTNRLEARLDARYTSDPDA